MRDCSRCKFCEKDYYYNDELEDEFPLYTCEKGNDTDLDFKCKDFEEFKPTPYVEKYTECDMCEHLSECKENGIYIDITTVNDTRKHFSCDKSKCLKNELPWVEVK